MQILVFTIALLLSNAMANENVAHGEWYPKRNYDKRYVTTYKATKISKPLKDFPWIQEDCHEDGDRFANWAKTMAYEVTYSGAVSFELLGIGIELGGERGRTVEFTFERWVHATRGIKARHTLYEEYENWEGVTRSELRDSQGNRRFGKKSHPFS